MVWILSLSITEASMAVLTDQFRRYVTRMLQSSLQADRPAYMYDPILA
jgi:hypothetical protein